MTSFAFLRTGLLDFLRERDVLALLSFPPNARRRYAEPFVLLGIKDFSTEGAGFGSYLGEEYDEERKCREERYGLRAELCLSLDLYGPPEGGEAALQELCDRLSEALQEKPLGLTLCGLRFGRTAFDENSSLLSAEGEARFSGLLYARREEEGEEISFEVRGGITLE